MTSPPPSPHAHWSTSSFGAGPDTSPVELSALREHLDLCSRLNRRWFRTRCGIEALQRFVAGRLVTTLVVATLLIAFGIGLS